VRGRRRPRRRRRVLKAFLTEQQNRGALARHELVSMLPALLLGIEPHHNVLDLCAAPGSKTTQVFRRGETCSCNFHPSGWLRASALTCRLICLVVVLAN